MYEYTYRIAAFDTNRNAKSNHFHYISKYVILRKKKKKDTINYRHLFRFDTFYVNG